MPAKYPMNNRVFQSTMRGLQEKAYANEWLVKMDDGSWLAWNVSKNEFVTVNLPAQGMRFPSREAAHEAGEAFAAELNEDLGMDVTYQTRTTGFVMNVGWF